ncbi:MAG: DUF3106 domain-containing protein [Bacteroidia bacterium]|nr:DUF3106 domain-containing protein [Bacteroidia bacterium]
MKRGWKVVLWILFGVLIVALIGGLTMQLWNWLVPALFGGPYITFWQTLGLLLLSKILFAGLGKGHHQGGGPPWKHQWKKKMYEKFSHMSPDEREAFKRRMADKWCSQSREQDDEGSSNV